MATGFKKDVLKKFFLIPVIIGLANGVFAVVFLKSLDLSQFFFLEKIGGYISPVPHGEGYREVFSLYPERFYLLPLIVAVGGLVSGLLSYFFSPESMGVGTDFAIKSYHSMKRLSLKDSIVKLIASSFVIGSGGTSGREGPIAFIGAGLGDTIARFMGLGTKDRKMLLAIGLGSGISGIFRAPLAGAIISAEVFFRKDFEVEAMLPGFVASVISYSVVGVVYGFTPLFNVPITPLSRENLDVLLFYALLGVVCGIVCQLFIKCFFAVQNRFTKLNIPVYLKPSLGGFVTGLVCIVTPIAIGNGYGWLQLIMLGEYTNIPGIGLGIVGVIVGVSFTLGSGGSGGVFGPSVMIGGLLGALFSLVVNTLFPDAGLSVASFMVVGMVSFFGGAAKAPLSTLILIAEMTGGYELLVPAMFSVFVTYLLSGKDSIFPSQVETKFDSPAYEDVMKYVMERLKVKDFMTRNPIVIRQDSTVEDASQLMKEKLIGGIPVVSATGELVGMVTRADLFKVRRAEWKDTEIRDVMTRDLIVVSPDTTLINALGIMIEHGIGRLPVVEAGKLLGIISRADIGKLIMKYT